MSRLSFSNVKSRCAVLVFVAVVGLSLLSSPVLAETATQSSVESGESPLRVALLGPLGSESSATGQPQETVRNRSLMVGLTHYGMTLGYQQPSYSVELRGYNQDNSTVYGIRGDYDFYPLQSGSFYSGAAYLNVSEFETELTKGDGTMYGAYVGYQHYLTPSVSFSVDAGPYQVEVTDDLSGVTSSGTEFILDYNLSLHFF
ncbi:MAG: hypothetical protein ABEK50_09880 [bacterium]